jgi:8-oxo-dGTP pyrophosphatase MutT (NUDIX family)
MEMVDVLDVNRFSPTGTVVNREVAVEKGYWTGSFNLWIVQVINDEQYVLYQRRAAGSTWAPSYLDVAVGGHYEAGETLLDGLREAEEELGKVYDPSLVKHIGRKLYLHDSEGRRVRSVVDVCIIRDDCPLEDFKLQEEELDALFRCNLDALIALHEGRLDSFEAVGIEIREGRQTAGKAVVTLDSFPYNWDNYHRKMAYNCRRFLLGDGSILY